MSAAPQDWDDQQRQRQASFLQSSLWGSFQQSLGHQPHFLIEKTWSCLLIERKTPFGKYLFAPYGPTLESVAATEASLKKTQVYAKQAGFDWLSIEPYIGKAVSRSLSDELPGLGAVRSNHNREPDLTRIINLNRPPGVILESISQSTRSFIRKNQRENFLTFRTSDNPADILIFTKMLSLVAKRKGVNFFSEEYFKKQAELLMPAGMMFLELALQDGQPVASAVIHDFGRMSSYTYAGSLPQARQTSASALLLWQAMLNAKARANDKMDLFGIAPDNASPTHPWLGFSSFKKKFGGQIIQRAGTWDIPLSGKYRLYRSANSARKLLRRH